MHTHVIYGFSDQMLHAFSRVYYSIKKGTPSYRKAILILSSLLGKKSVNIILADDDVEDRELFLEVMEEIMPHVNITVAENGQHLMDLLAVSSLPDVIFLDLNMPLKSGHECLQEIRNNQSLSTIPVIIYSTSRSPKDIDATYDRGANFYFPKPDSFRDFKVVMKKVLALELDEFVKPRHKEHFVLNVKPH
jgi:CheY-like chemotaxis protein